MKRGFYTIMSAQFFSSLADNALLIASIALLMQLDGPAWMTPLLKFFFTVSYVVLAPFVGPFADSLPKGKVMFVTNTIKIAGCLTMLFYEWIAAAGITPYIVVLLAYGIVGLGAAAYSPAKYGILTELLPPEKLVVANGWIEGLTVGSIIVGTVLGGILIGPRVSGWLSGVDIPFMNTGIDTPAETAIAVIVVFYLIAAAFNLYIPDTGSRYAKQETHPIRLVVDFGHCFRTLWADKLGQITLAVTTLFWGAGATLQFIVLRWADQHLNMPLSKAAVLQGVFAVGIAFGSVAAARFIPLKKALIVIPFGIAMGALVMTMTLVTAMPMVYALMVIIGMMAGFFVVPMNALLQHRGHVLLSAGHSIAVQNFNENLCILVMLAVYAALLSGGFHINTIIVMFGCFVMVTMFLVRMRHLHNKRFEDVEARIGEAKH
ncbi:MAG: lysophospholipid transporter LplT [Burkholderiales bacterium]|nr:lysophospholipid transporter LplT [Burkholderiales bacterium]